MAHLFRPFLWALVLPTVMLTAACTTESQGEATTAHVEAVAHCIAQEAGDTRRFAWGSDYAKGQSLAVGIREFARCGVFWQALASSDLRSAVTRALPPFLVPHASYRHGLYEAVLPPGVSPAMRLAFSGLARWLDEFAVEKRSARMCANAPEEALAKASELELPFAVATLGHRGQMANADQALKLAQLLIEEVDSLSSRDSGIHCNEGARLRHLVEDLERFVHGKHPWAPGCGIAAQGEDFRLVCTGETSNAQP